MNPILPSGYDYLWSFGLIVMLMPVATTVLVALIFSEVRKIRRNGESKSRNS
jgi:hypothetical protein